MIIAKKRVGSVLALFSEEDITKINVGDHAIIHLKDFPAKALKAKVTNISLSSYSDVKGSPFTFIDGSVNTTNKKYLVTLSLLTPPSFSVHLRSGMSAKVAIEKNNN